MKKKFLASLMMVGMILPMGVNAATGSGSVHTTVTQVCSEGECTNTIVLILTNTSDDDITFNSTSEISIDLYDKDPDDNSDALALSETEITLVSVVGSGSINLTKESGDKVTGTYDSMEDTVLEADDELEIGTFVFTYDEDIEDCSVFFDTTWGVTEVTVDTDNTQTGINMPVVAIGVAGALAIGAYAVVSRKNKIFNV